MFRLISVTSTKIHAIKLEMRVEYFKSVLSMKFQETILLGEGKGEMFGRNIIQL